MKVGCRCSLCQPVATAKARFWLQVALWGSSGRYGAPHVMLKVSEDLQAPRTGYVEAKVGLETSQDQGKCSEVRVLPS